MSDRNVEKSIISLTPPPDLLPEHDQEPPVLTDDLLRLSCALAAASYDMDVQPWLEAGWRDVTLMYEGELTGVVDAVNREPADLREGIDKAAAEVKLVSVQQRLAHFIPLQLTGTLKQRYTSNTLSAMMLEHPMAEGQYLVSIAITGTGKQLYDWVSNLRMRVEEGAHLGFLQLSRQLEGQLGSIEFPAIAAELGLQKLTLMDVMAECRLADSRFRILCTGHSQGGAVMQLFMLHMIRDMGVLPKYVTGVGFASPSVTMPGEVDDPLCWPMVHVLNDQDRVPHMGALCHLGCLLVYDTDDALRQACYRQPQQPDPEADEAACRVFDCMRTTPEILLIGIAFCQHAMAHPGEEISGAVRTLAGENEVVHAILDGAGRELTRVLRYVVRRVRLAYQSVMGHMPAPEDEERMLHAIEAAAGDVTPQRLVGAMARLGLDAHTIVGAQGCRGAYHYIADRGVSSLRPGEDPKDE